MYSHICILTLSHSRTNKEEIKQKKTETEKIPVFNSFYDQRQKKTLFAFFFV